MLHSNSLGLLLPRGNKTDPVFEEIACRYAANNAVEKTQNSGETQIRKNAPKDFVIADAHSEYSASHRSDKFTVKRRIPIARFAR